VRLFVLRLGADFGFGANHLAEPMTVALVQPFLRRAPLPTLRLRRGIEARRAEYHRHNGERKPIPKLLAVASAAHEFHRAAKPSHFSCSFGIDLRWRGAPNGSGVREVTTGHGCLQ
jgi:hypothetical protein